MVLYNAPTSWKHMPLCFYVNTPGAEVLDSFPIQISEGLPKWLNHQVSRRGWTPSGWLIEVALTQFVQSPACSGNLQAAFNKMSPVRRLCRWLVIRKHPESDKSHQKHRTSQLTWTKQSLRWSILRCCYKLGVKGKGERLANGETETERSDRRSENSEKVLERTET